MRAAVMEAICQPRIVRDVPDPTPPARMGCRWKLVRRTIALEEAAQALASMDRFATVGVNVIGRYGS